MRDKISLMATPTLSIATDKPVYSPGELVTLTATYSDEQGASFTVNVAAAAADAASPPNTANATTSFAVQTSAPALMAVTVTDDHADTWAEVSNVPGTAILTTAAPSH